MSVFSSSARTDSSPRGHTESLFSCLDRRAGADYDRIRALLESWLASVPDAPRLDLSRRIQCGDEHAFHSAFLELYLHALLTSLGHSIEAHPRMTGSPKQPDYLAISPDTGRTFVEATVVTEPPILNGPRMCG